MSYSFNFDPVLRNFDLLLKGLGLGLAMAVAAILVGALIGFFLAFGTLSKRRLISGFCRAFIAVFRNLPLLLLVFFVYFALPQWRVQLDGYSCFIIALSVYAAAGLAEVFRGGLLALNRGLTEAGLAIGLRPFQIKIYIVLPVLLRSVLPSLGNSFISLFKDTSIAASIAVHDLTFYARKINTESFRVIETWMVVSLLYIGTTMLIAFVLRLLEARVRASLGVRR